MNYSTTDKECLAVIASVKKFRPYILGKKVIVNTDHAAIRWIINKVDLQGRYARWKALLSEFDLEIKTRPGRVNSNADALSRIKIEEGSREVIDDEPEHFTLFARAL